MSRGERLLWREQWIPAPLERVFAFFSDARNLAVLTPPWLDFRIEEPAPEALRAGARIDYRIRIFGAPLRWRTRIEVWEPPHRFVDVQERGPYRLWEHSHWFAELAGGVLMTDRVRYRLPLGPLGHGAHELGVRAMLARIFDYRFQQIRERFGQPTHLEGG